MDSLGNINYIFSNGNQQHSLSEFTFTLQLAATYTLCSSFVLCSCWFSCYIRQPFWFRRNDYNSGWNDSWHTGCLRWAAPSLLCMKKAPKAAGVYTGMLATAETWLAPAVLLPCHSQTWNTWLANDMVVLIAPRMFSHLKKTWITPGWQ